jgi:hypothetical protein
MPDGMSGQQRYSDDEVDRALRELAEGTAGEPRFREAVVTRLRGSFDFAQWYGPGARRVCQLRHRQDRQPVGDAIDRAYRCRWRSRQMAFRVAGVGDRGRLGSLA